jgi:hypothetical protein
MHEPVSDPCQQQLQEWHFRYEVVNSYHRALRFLAPSIDRMSVELGLTPG